MGRNCDFVVRSFYKFDGIKNKSVCNVCDSHLSGKHITNLRRHLKQRHNESFQKAVQNSQEHCEVQKPKKIKISYEVDKDDLISSILKIVTKDGRPFVHLDSEGFREIVEPIYNALSMSHISSHNVIDYVCVRQQSIVEEIKRLVKGRLVSLKIDVATRLERSVLGVNLQVIDSRTDRAEIVIKTLEIILLLQSHTGSYIKQKLIEIISEYNIGVEQIYSITTDNGKSMIKAIECLNDDIAEESFDNNVMEMLGTISISNISLVRCAAHTLQLCVNDVHKQEDIAKNLVIARKLCKLLRTDKYRRSLIQNGKNVPPLDVVTRWNSTYLMLKKLYDIREFINMEFNIITSNIEWDWVELYIDAFQSVYAATLKLQQEQLLFTDFYKLWMELKLQSEESSNYLTKKLLTRLKARESKLLENEAMLAAIHMDPRISLILTEQQKSIAKQNLKKIAYRVFKMNEDPVTETYTPENISTNNFLDCAETNNAPTESSLLSVYLDKIQDVVQTNAEETISDKLRKIYTDIENFNAVYGRLPLSSNILDFFYNLKYKTPNLFQLALVVFAAPATQVSVERAFSALNFILSERRYKLNTETINSLLIVKLNS